ncbi:GFA family protein [Thalassotalea sp. ND16A]|uniref:GFA family protein n=1 Tax=Thalassotalea sp. ND16A TaxID=1535422 RepID=UPI001269884A|nr:GFA family protein [Thalassotalea sp. ND16A]
MVTGECNCEAVAFEITSNISDVFICHCSICRRSTGSNGIAVTIINISDFRWEKA